MRIFHKYDIYGRTEPSIIYLAKPGKRLFCALGGIDTSTVSLSLKTNNTAELTFTVDKYINNTLTDGYEELDELMELYCDGIWFKIVDPPTINNNGMRETKEITAESYEIMLTQYKLKNFKINMGEEDSYEMMYQATHDTSKFYQIKFYDPDNEDLSFLHLVLKHADVPGWKIGYVDNITPDDDGKLLPNNICNFEVDDQNVYAFLTQEAAQGYKCVFEFDTVNMTINVYRPDSLGKDTNVVLGFRNIQNSVTISRDENLVTQFYVDGLDNYNIDLANFGDSLINDLSYFCCEPYMNAILQEKYTAWQDYRESRRDEYCDLSREYNKNLDVLSELTNRVPVDTAQANWFGQKVDDLKDAYDSNMAIIKGLESIYVDDEKNFDLAALKVSSDWPLYESIMNYTLPAIVAALQAQDETVEGFGKGNIISCVNPVVLGQDWYMVGSGTSSFKTIQIDDAPAYGITRGVAVTGTDGGIYQHNISIEPSQRYTLSCFVKGSGTFYLGYNNTGEDRKNISYSITSSWTRVYTSFNLSSHLIDVAFTGTSDFTICGMQLEMGDAPSQFGYFTQSESIMKAYETDWKLYGIAELKTKIATYDACIKELKKNGYADGYNPLSGYEEAYFTQMHQKYLDYLNLKEQAEAALAERQAEYDAAEKPEIQEKRNQIAKDVLMENFGKVQDKYPAFTEKETYIIKSLYNQSTYTNENIIITTLDSTSDAVDKAITLYKDAVEELYVESHPQYTYTDEIENIYALPEFKEYHDQLAVNDFVRVGLTDTNYIKLRVIEITYNPCDLDESMEVTFSNMIQYKAKRNDYNTLLNDALNASDRNGGRVNSVNKSTTSDYVITSDAIKQIFSNPLFNSMLGGATTGGTGSGGTITADMIVAELVKAKEGVFDKLTVDTAFMKYLDVKLVSADTITTRILEAEQANIEKLSAKIIESNQISADMANIKNLVSGKAGIGELQTINLTAQNVTIDQAVITDLIAKKIAVGDLMAQNALANQIVLISKDNKPTIAFLESTQQFYDSTGNVRVQIGMDGNGDFNFIVRNGDKTALFDENGITQTGIPNNTIINDMIDNATITKDKLGFQVIEPNEQGGIDITNIYDGKGNQWWGIEKTSITDDYTKQIKNVTDTLTGEIEQKVSNTQYITDQEAIQTEFSEVKQDVSGITTTVSSMRTDLSEAQEKITANSSSITQNADSISFMVTGTRESGFELTQDFISMVSDNISIKAENVKIDSIIEAMNTSIDSSTTRINGGIIDTSTVNAMLIAAQTLRSKNFKDSSVVDGIYAQEGLEINMETGAMKAKNFAIDGSGNAYFKGNGEFEGKITASSGHIGGTNGFIIEAGKLYSGMDAFNSDSAGVYLGTDGIALGGGNFTVDKSGNLTAKSGTFTGKIEANDGYIGGWNINNNSLTARDGSVSINPDYLKYGSNFNVDSAGNLTATNATISGKVDATTGTFNNGTFNSVNIESGQIGGLSIANGTISGDNLSITSDGRISAANASISGAITATSLTLGSGVTIGVSKVSGLADVATSGDYNDLENKPDIPSDMEFYIKKDGTVGTLTEEVQNIPAGAKGFKVSSDGLLQASNAIIYGTIFASAGLIGGFNISTTADKNHAYSNTLYTQTSDSNGNTYQAGIKGNSTNNASTEAAFYIRKKENGATSWSGSTTPFFVQKNGNLYAQDTTIGTALYICKDSSSYSSRNKIISYDNSQFTVGVFNTTQRISFDYQSVNFESITGIEMASIVSYDNGYNAWLYKGNSCKTFNIGTDGRPLDNGYFKKLYLNGTDIEDLMKTGTTPSGLVENTIRIGSTDSGLEPGHGNTYTVYSKSQWSYKDSSGNVVKLSELPITCRTIGAALSGHKHSEYALASHTHSDYVPTSGNSTSSPISGTLYMANNKGWNVLNTSGESVTGIYCTANAANGGAYTDDYGNNGKGNLVVLSHHSYTTVLRGSTIMIGNKTDSKVRMPSLTENKSATKYLVKDEDGYIGWKTGNGGGGGNTITSASVTSTQTLNAGNNATATASLNGTTVQFTFGIPQGAKGETGERGPRGYQGADGPTGATGPKGEPGSSGIFDDSQGGIGASYSNGTHKILPKLNGSWTKNVINLGSSNYLFASVWVNGGTCSGSDRNIKEEINLYHENIEKAYMEFQPVSYKFKNFVSTDSHDRIHYGLIAQDVEDTLHKYNITNEEAGFLLIDYLDKPNEAGKLVNYGLRYDEFIPLNMHMTQKAHHRIDSLEEQNNSLISENQSLKNEILMLQGQLSLINQRLQKLEEKAC